MNTREKLKMLEEMMDLEEGTLNEASSLSKIEEWDSISHLSLIIMLEEQFGRDISGDEVRSLKTVQEILDRME